MLIVLAVYSGILGAIYILSLKKYDDVLCYIDKKEYPFIGIMPIGLYLINTFKYSFNTSYDRRLMAAINELSGNKSAVLGLKAHWGNKISLVLLSIWFSCFVGCYTTLDAGYVLFSVILAISTVYFSDKDLFNKVKKRRLAIQIEFPDFVNKLILLINAGMTVHRAWERISSASRDTPLYRELGIALQNIRSGMPEHKAYEEFAKRCHAPVITRFITVILQNIRKGNDELVPILRVFANECWELRKSTAKRYGEEASTKLLLPMMLMFIAILLIVGMPAVLALKNI